MAELRKLNFGIFSRLIWSVCRVAVKFCQIVKAIDLHSEGQAFGISPFFCNFKMVKLRSINFHGHMHVDKSS